MQSCSICCFPSTVHQATSHQVYNRSVHTLQVKRLWFNCGDSITDEVFDLETERTRSFSNRTNPEEVHCGLMGNTMSHTPLEQILRPQTSGFSHHTSQLLFPLFASVPGDQPDVSFNVWPHPDCEVRSFVPLLIHSLDSVSLHLKFYWEVTESISSSTVVKYNFEYFHLMLLSNLNPLHFRGKYSAISPLDGWSY